MGGGWGSGGGPGWGCALKADSPGCAVQVGFVVLLLAVLGGAKLLGALLFWSVGAFAVLP